MGRPCFPSFSELMSAQPDLTKTVVTIQNHGAVEGTPNNNHLRNGGTGTLDKAPSTAAYADNVLNAQKALLLGEGNTDIDLAKDADLESRPDSLYSEIRNRNSTLSCQLPGNIDVEAMAVATVTHAGGRISLPDSGRNTQLHDLSIFHSKETDWVGSDTVQLILSRFCCVPFMLVPTHFIILVLVLSL